MTFENFKDNLEALLIEKAQEELENGDYRYTREICDSLENLEMCYDICDIENESDLMTWLVIFGLDIEDIEDEQD